jgi:hypothetical protein
LKRDRRRPKAVEGRSDKALLVEQVAWCSDVVIQRELVRVRAQADGIGFVAPLVVYKGFDQLFGENVAF